MEKKNNQEKIKITDKDWYLNQPCEGATWLELYKSVTVPANSEVTLIEWRVPPNIKVARLAERGFGFDTGDGTKLSAIFTINGSEFPANENTSNQRDVFVPIYQLMKMFKTIWSNDTVKVVFKNTSLTDNAVCWAKITGWYYG